MHSVVVAFRTGLCAVEVGRTIWSPSRGLTSDYWSVLCPGLALEEAHEVIKAFSESTVRLLNRKLSMQPLTLNSIFRSLRSRLLALLQTME